MKNILLAIDLNGSEKLLLERAYEWAKAFKANIWMLHVVAPEPEFVGFGVGPQYIRDTRAEELRKEHRMLDEYAKVFSEKGIEAEGLLIRGATTEMICSTEGAWTSFSRTTVFPKRCEGVCDEQSKVNARKLLLCFCSGNI